MNDIDFMSNVAFNSNTPYGLWILNQIREMFFIKRTNNAFCSIEQAIQIALTAGDFILAH